jgi:hypothetical protein
MESEGREEEVGCCERGQEGVSTSRKRRKRALNVVRGV